MKSSRDKREGDRRGRPYIPALIAFEVLWWILGICVAFYFILKMLMEMWTS